MLTHIIVRIEFSPVVEIGASNGHNLLQEATYEYEELTLSFKAFCLSRQKGFLLGLKIFA